MSDVLKLEKSNGIATITITRGDRMNPLGLDGDGAAFKAACEDIETDKSIRCAVLTGEGRAFSAGGDLKAMKDRSGAFGGSVSDRREGYTKNIHVIVKSLYNLEVPLIAAVNGPAIGLGCDVACMADIRIASEKARFGMPFLRLGIIPGDGGVWLLTRTIGNSRAAEMVFTGDYYGAETAKEWGIVSKVTTPESLMEETMALAERIAAQPPQALRAAKSLLRQAQTASYEQIMEVSASMQAILHTTEDHEEGVSALLEKRTPVFTGK